MYYSCQPLLLSVDHYKTKTLIKSLQTKTVFQTRISKLKDITKFYHNPGVTVLHKKEVESQIKIKS